MKKLLIAAALLAGASSTALAADAIVEIPEAPIAVVEGFTWTGFYVGGHAGYGFGETEVDAFDAAGNAVGNVAGFAPNQDYDIDGFLGGVQVGYNHQINQLVLGVEADFTFADIEGESGDIFTAAPTGGFYTTNVDWFGTVRGRVGFAVDRTLFYGTGGFAYGRVENTIDTTDFVGGAVFSEDETSTGWTAGGGVEHAFTDNVTVKLEYLFVDLRDQEVEAGAIGSAEFDNQFHTVKLGFNYKF